VVSHGCGVSRAPEAQYATTRACSTCWTWNWERTRTGSRSAASRRTEDELLTRLCPLQADHHPPGPAEGMHAEGVPGTARSHKSAFHNDALRNRWQMTAHPSERSA